MTKLDIKNSYAKSGKDITKYPLQMDNKNYGVKRKAQVHNVVLKNSKTGQVFGYKTITEMKFTDYLLLETNPRFSSHKAWQEAVREACPDAQFTPSSYDDATPTGQQAVWWNDKDNPVVGDWADGKGVVYPFAALSGSVMNEADKSQDTRLPASVIGEIASLVRKGAKDLAQAWKNAVELVHTAYHVANVKRPTPDQKGAWKQYEDLLRTGVKALADTRGLSGDWRLSKTAFAEGIQTPELDEVLMEASQFRNRKHRIFVRTRHIGFDDRTTETEVDAADMSEVVHKIQHQARRQGKAVHIKPIGANHMRVTIHVKGADREGRPQKTRDETIVDIKDWSL